MDTGGSISVGGGHVTRAGARVRACGSAGAVRARSHGHGGTACHVRHTEGVMYGLDVLVATTRAHCIRAWKTGDWYGTASSMHVSMVADNSGERMTRGVGQRKALQWMLSNLLVVSTFVL